MSHSLPLSSDSLLSKWGFNDGDEPDWLLDMLDDYGLPYPEDWHAILRRLVCEHLLPVLNERVEVVEYQTNHNPIRAVTVDGVDVSAATVITPKRVDVPVRAVLDLIEAERSQR